MNDISIGRGRATSLGGGISAANGSLTLNNSEVYGESVGAGVGGGGIHIFQGILTLNNSTAGGFTRGDNSGGGGILARSSSVTLNNSRVQNSFTNGIASHGAGIHISSGSQSSSLILNGSSINSNLTTGIDGRGGGIYAVNTPVILNDSTVSGNRTNQDSSPGGGIYTSGEPLTLNRSTVSSNITFGANSSGGGIYADDSLTLTNSTVSSNQTGGTGSGGGGISAFGPTILINSTVSRNVARGAASHGGGIAAQSSITITNSTITGNSTTSSGTSGGGVWIQDNKLTLLNSIIAGNTSPIAPDLLEPVTPSVNFDARFSLIGNNSGTTLVPSSTPDPVRSNLVGTPASPIDPMLGPLQLNGGFTETHALLTGSPAIDLASLTLSSHFYPFGGSFDDTFGGPALAPQGGTLVSSGYQFGANQGLTLTSPNVDPESYAIDLFVRLDNAAISQKLIDFWNGNSEAGLYASAGTFQFRDLDGLPVVQGGAFTVGTFFKLQLRRDGLTKRVTLRIGSSDVFSFIDTTNYAVLSATNKTIRFFLDDSESGNQSGPGYVEDIRVSNVVSSADQRGLPFVRMFGTNVDIGAYESQTFPASAYVVNTINDEVNYSNSVVSLREAITVANGVPGPNTISFDAAAFAGSKTIALALGELNVSETLTVNGTGQTRLAISGQNHSRVLHYSSESGNLNLSGLTVTGGRALFGRGGGISFRSDGLLSLNASTISNNTSINPQGGGGGIFSNSGSITLTNSTVSGNQAEGGGGGIDSGNGTLTLVNSTIVGNSTASYFEGS